MAHGSARRPGWRFRCAGARGRRATAIGIFVVALEELTSNPLPGVASLGRRTAVEQAPGVLLETHVLDWPAALPINVGCGRAVRVVLRLRLHDERKHESIDALRTTMASDASGQANVGATTSVRSASMHAVHGPRRGRARRMVVPV